MRVTVKSHPELWEMLSPPAISKIVGLHIDDDKFKFHRDQARTIFAHLSDREQEIVAMQIAYTHPGHEAQPVVKKVSIDRRIDEVHTNLLAIIIIGIIILALILLARSAHAQGIAGATKPNSAQEQQPKNPLPSTVIPLEDADKVRFLQMQKELDGYIEQSLKDQVDADKMEKLIAQIRNEIEQEAQKLADKSKVDTKTLVLDLDKLAWISKEPPK